MKRIIALILVIAFLLSGCGSVEPSNQNNNINEESVEIKQDTKTASDQSSSENTTEQYESFDSVIEPTDENLGIVSDEGTAAEFDPEKEFTSLDNDDLLQNLEDSVYNELLDQIDSDKYFIENVEATYISKEYIEELAYNSKSNIFFGYTLDELNQQFQGERFVFTLGDNGNTIVQSFEKFDDTYEKVLKDVAIGTGVILLCVTVSAVTGGVAPAVSMIFAVSAKTGAVAALSGGAIGGASAGIIEAINGGSKEDIFKAASVGAGKGYKVGAFSGAIAGGAGEAIALKGATLNGLSMNEAAMIQKESKYPLSVIKNFRNIEEYKVYRSAGLTPQEIAGKTALVQEVDLDSVVDEVGRTNLQRIKDGLSPIDPLTKKAYELHHVGQKSDSIIAVLTNGQHDLPGLHVESFGVDHGSAWQKIVRQFWKSYINARGYTI